MIANVPLRVQDVGNDLAGEGQALSLARARAESLRDVLFIIASHSSHPHLGSQLSRCQQKRTGRRRLPITDSASLCSEYQRHRQCPECGSLF